MTLETLSLTHPELLEECKKTFPGLSDAVFEAHGGHVNQLNGSLHIASISPASKGVGAFLQLNRIPEGP